MKLMSDFFMKNPGFKKMQTGRLYQRVVRARALVATGDRGENGERMSWVCKVYSG
jgi:hypothetical protein